MVSTLKTPFIITRNPLCALLECLQEWGPLTNIQLPHLLVAINPQHMALTRSLTRSSFDTYISSGLPVSDRLTRWTPLLTMPSNTPMTPAPPQLGKIVHQHHPPSVVCLFLKSAPPPPLHLRFRRDNASTLHVTLKDHLDEVGLLASLR